MTYVQDEAVAVLIFSENELSREMLYPEFEAVLDGFIPLPEQASTEVHAVYLRIIGGDDGPVVKGAVFFLINFDKDGFPDRSWNVPLEQLVESAERGPDLGGGPIRLSCRSQCSIAWHQQQLWDPVMEPEHNQLEQIRAAISRNRLQLSFYQPEEVTEAPPVEGTGGAPSPQLQKEKQRLEQQLKEQKLRVSALQEQHRQELSGLKQSHQQRLQLQQAEIEDSLKSRQQADQQRQQLQQQNEMLEKKIEGLREYFEHKLNSIKNVDQAALDSLREHYENEREAEIEAATAPLQEQLQMREIETMYQQTQTAGLQEEIARLRGEREDLLNNSGNRLLEQLHQQGVSFVTYQPGAGHMTIPVADIAGYLEDQQGYIAKVCGVGDDLYQNWLSHYRNPVCCALVSGGEQCGASVDRVDQPRDFLLGESDRCEKHRHSTEELAQRMASS
jgi:hypothetical protein